MVKRRKRRFLSSQGAGFSRYTNFVDPRARATKTVAPTVLPLGSALGTAVAQGNRPPKIVWDPSWVEFPCSIGSSRRELTIRVGPVPQNPAWAGTSGLQKIELPVILSRGVIPLGKGNTVRRGKPRDGRIGEPVPESRPKLLP
jgi:hypothetical protein